MSDTPQPPTPDEPQPLDQPAEVPAGEAPEGGTRRAKLPLVIGAVVVVAVLALAALAYLYLRGTKDVLVDDVPSNAAAYVTVHLDPGLQQKWQIKELLDRFPEAKAEELGDAVERLLQPALREAGVDYAKDVEPWLGSQIGLYVSDIDHTTSELPGAVLIQTTDPEAAERFFLGFAPPGEQPLSWTEEDHGGVTIHTGTGGAELSFAVVDDTLVIGDDAQRVGEVIDVAQGGASLSDSEGFQEAVGALPSRRVATMYFDVGALGSALPELPPEAAGQDADQALDAVRGMAMSLSADADGVAMDFALAVDWAAMSEQQADALRAGGAERLVGWLPEDAYGFLSLGGLRGLIDQYSSIVGGDPQAKAFLDELDLDAIGDALAIEVGPGADAPDGALVVEVQDEAAAAGVVEDLFASVMGQEPAWEERDHDGTTIHVLTGEGMDPGLSPSYAVTDGVAIVASTVGELERVLDASDDGTIERTEGFEAASRHLVDDPVAILYVDVSNILGEFSDFLGDDPQTTLDGEVQPILRRAHAVVLSAGDDGDVYLVRLFVVIGD